MRATFRGLMVAAGLILSTGVAQAHPHIWIDAKARIVFNDQGELTSIANTWTFDEAFSIWQIQGLDTNSDGVTSSEEMQDLADENLKGLAEYKFYTLAGEGDGTVPMAAMDDGKFVFQNNRSTFTFGIEPQSPYRIKGKFELAIADPEYYVAITFADPSDVELVNAPAGCRLGSEPPRELTPDVQALVAVCAEGDVDLVLGDQPWLLAHLVDDAAGRPPAKQHGRRATQHFNAVRVKGVAVVLRNVAQTVLINVAGRAKAAQADVVAHPPAFTRFKGDAHHVFERAPEQVRVAADVEFHRAAKTASCMTRIIGHHDSPRP